MTRIVNTESFVNGKSIPIKVYCEVDEVDGMWIDQVFNAHSCEQIPVEALSPDERKRILKSAWESFCVEM